MNLTLNRNRYDKTGIYGKMYDESGTFLYYTLEHAYEQESGGYEPKVPEGVYTCQRGMHQLANMTAPFQTFEVTNVPGHTNILIHPGNYDADSEGCILLGTGEGVNMVTNSRAAFGAFMDLEQNVDTFTLTVSSQPETSECLAA